VDSIPLCDKFFISIDTCLFRHRVEYYILCIVILAVLHILPIEIVNDESATELKVEVSHAAGEKCERCWCFSNTVGKNPKHITLCERCAKVLE